MPFRFHASAQGGWINDPNGLIAVPGGYRLFAQYRASHPFDDPTEWASFFSPNLLDWQFEGVAIPTRGGRSAYSGCVVPGSGVVSAYLTEQDNGPPQRQRQVVWASSDHGARFEFAGRLDGLPQDRANFRDPFLLSSTPPAIVIAEPGGWNSWRDDPASRLAIYTEAGPGRWRRTGEIGPWMDASRLWEVPVVIRAEELGGEADEHVLIVSVVDRSDDRAWCEVRYWFGRIEAHGFTRAADFAPDGERLDAGPDFYATCIGRIDSGRPVLVAWASNWETARRMPWPGAHGGPISLARRLSIVGRRLCQSVDQACIDAFDCAVDGVPAAGMGVAHLATAPWRLKMDGESRLEITADNGVMTIERAAGEGALDWHGQLGIGDPDEPPGRLRIFIDGPLIEIILEPQGRSITVAVPGSCLDWSLEAGDIPVPIEWRVRS